MTGERQRNVDMKEMNDMKKMNSKSIVKSFFKKSNNNQKKVVWKSR